MIREARDLIDAIMVPATSTAASLSDIGSVVRELGLPYLVDPRAPMFQFAARAGMGSRYSPFAGLYGPRFIEVLRGRARFEQLATSDWRAAAVNVARLQADLARWSGGAPLMVLPPYLAVDADLAEAWHLNLAMLDEVVRQTADEPVAAVAVLTGPYPAEPDLDALDAMLGAIGRRVRSAFIWLDECQERLLSSDTVRRLAQLVTAHPDLDVYNLHGGYLSLLLHRFGLAGVGSGTAYGETSRVRNLGRPSGGPVPLRYYMQSIHTLVDPQLAGTYIRAIGGACSCYACMKASASLAPSKLDADGLMLHYVLAKEEERKRVVALDLDGLIDELWEAYHLAADSVERLPQELQADFPHHHLESWAVGLGAASVPSNKPR